MSLVFNVQIHPYKDLQYLFPDIDDYEEGYPAIELAFENVTSRNEATYTYSKYYTATDLIPIGDSILERLTFKVPDMSEDARSIGFSGMFTLVFSLCNLYLDSDFLTTGGLTLMFGKTNAVSDKKMMCLKRKTCLYSKRIDINTATIYTAFSPGEYTVALMYKGMTEQEKTMLDEVYSSIPYSIHIKTQPIFHAEDRFNCEAGHIPHSLNSPGLIDERGFLRYSDLVMADFKSAVQFT